MDEAMKSVIDRRNQRLEEMWDEYEEEPAFSRIRESSNGIVISSGSVMARLMMVGFSPGREEDLRGLPFLGDVGKILDELLSSVDMRRSEVYLTNVVKYRYDGVERGFTGMVNTSMKYLRKEIAVVKPVVIAVMGADVLKQFEPTKRLSQCNGQIINKKDRSIVPMYHPAVAVREPHRRAELMNGMKAVRRAVEAYS